MAPTPDPGSPDLATWLLVQEELAQLVAHDMRNPLQAVIANASFLEDVVRPSDQELRETVADIRSSAEVMLRLIENNVAIARLERAGASLPLAAVSLQSAVQTAVERCNVAAMSSSVSLGLQGSENPRVMADLGLLDLMIQNMVANAIQHSRRGWLVTVRVETEATRAAVAIVDQGVPFGPFEKHFTREAQGEIKFKSDGRYSRGLGLYVVGLVSHAFGGTIEASREGPLSVLRVWLPLAP